MPPSRAQEKMCAARMVEGGRCLKAHWPLLPRRAAPRVGGTGAALAAADVFEGELPAAPVVVGLYGVGDVEGGLAVECWL